MTLFTRKNLPALRYKAAYWLTRLLGKGRDEASFRAKRSASYGIQRMIHNSTQSLAKSVFSAPCARYEADS